MATHIENDIRSRPLTSITAALIEVAGFIGDVKELSMRGSISAAEGAPLVDAANDLRIRLCTVVKSFGAGHCATEN